MQVPVRLSIVPVHYYNQLKENVIKMNTVTRPHAVERLVFT